MKRLGLLVLPLAVGLALAALWQIGMWPNHIIYVRADLGTLALLAGAAGALFSGAGLGVWAMTRRRYEQRLENVCADQADSHRRFIRRLDHELKNPLTAIRAALANLEDRDNPILCSVRSQVDRLARLSADLRKLADLETQPVEQEPVDLGGVLDEVLDLVQERPEKASRSLRLALPQVPWPLPAVAGDRDLLLLALHNVVDNALKFSRPSDTIEIRAFEDGPTVAIEVADTGPGVQEQDLPHLGEELYRGATARSIEGSGLGLALVRAIVTRHRGTMAVRSRLGQGTVITLRFPVARP